jgi:hypothetical protein
MAPRSGAAPLPCLNSNNCIIAPEKPRNPDFNKLTPAARRSAWLLEKTVRKMAEKYGLERLGFLTLTIDPKQAAREGWDPKNPKDVQKRFKSLRTNVLNARYRGLWIRVIERHKSTRLHYHVLVVVDGDIRTGTNFKSFESDPWGSINERLKEEWKYLGNLKYPGVLQSHGFGVCSLEPIRSTEEAIGKYVGKYIAKHIETRLPIDKGVRLVEFGRPVRIGNTKFAWNSDGAKIWRAKGQEWQKKIFADAGYGAESYNFGVRSGPCRSRDNFGILKAVVGPRWAYNSQEEIIKTTLPTDYVYPSLAAYKKEEDARFLRETAGRRYFLRERAARPQQSAEVKSLLIQIKALSEKETAFPF